MKKLLIFTSLLLALLLLVCACGEENSEVSETLPETLGEDTAETVYDTEPVTIPVTEPVVTDPVTEPETLADTEPTTEAITVSPVDALMESVMSKNQFVDLGDYHIVTDMKINLMASMNGMETNMALTGGLQMTQSANHGMALQLNLPTIEPYALVYIDGVMYLSSGDSKYRCPMTDVELALVWSELMEDLFPAEGEAKSIENDMLGNITGLVSSMPLSAMFAESEMITDEASGDITVTLTGISPQIKLLLKLLTNSMEIPEIEGVSDMDLSLLLDTLSTFDMDAFCISLTVDKNFYIKASAVTLSLDMLNAPDLVGDIPMTATVMLTTTLDRSPQTVSAPEDADIYEETDWRSLFGIYTAEYLGLVPDASGMITLSEEPDAFALQYQYISTHQKDFEAVTFALTARASDFEALDDGTVRGTLYQVYTNGTSAYYPYLYVCFPADLADGMTIPEDGSTVSITAILAIAADGESYYDLTATSYQLISAPAVAG